MVFVYYKFDYTNTWYAYIYDDLLCIYVIVYMYILCIHKTCTYVITHVLYNDTGAS